MCFFICISTNCEARHKRGFIHIYCIVLLVVCISLLNFSVFYDTPWVRIVLKKDADTHSLIQKNDYIRQLDSVVKKNSKFQDELTFHSSPQNKNMETTTNVMPLHHETFNDVVINGVKYDNNTSNYNSYWNIANSAINVKTTNSSNNKSNNYYSPNTSNTTESIYLISLWSLHTVVISIPEFDYYKSVSIEKIPDDPILAAALSVAGVYKALNGLQTGNTLVVALSSVALIFLMLGGICASIFFFIDCLFSTYNWLYQNNNSRWYASSTTPLIHGESRSYYDSPSNLKREPLLLTGVLTLIATACLGAGFVIWFSRIYYDCKTVLEAIGQFIGHNGLAWFINHLSSEFETGFIQYLAALLIAALISCTCIFTDIFSYHEKTPINSTDSALTREREECLSYPQCGNNSNAINTESAPYAQIIPV